MLKALQLTILCTLVMLVRISWVTAKTADYSIYVLTSTHNGDLSANYEGWKVNTGTGKPESLFFLPAHFTALISNIMPQEEINAMVGYFVRGNEWVSPMSEEAARKKVFVQWNEREFGRSVNSIAVSPDQSTLAFIEYVYVCVHPGKEYCLASSRIHLYSGGRDRILLEVGSHTADKTFLPEYCNPDPISEWRNLSLQNIHWSFDNQAVFVESSEHRICADVIEENHQIIAVPLHRPPFRVGSAFHWKVAPSSNEIAVVSPVQSENHDFTFKIAKVRFEPASGAIQQSDFGYQSNDLGLTNVSWLDNSLLLTTNLVEGIKDLFNVNLVSSSGEWTHFTVRPAGIIITESAVSNDARYIVARDSNGLLRSLTLDRGVAQLSRPFTNASVNLFKWGPDDHLLVGFNNGYVYSVFDKDRQLLHTINLQELQSLSATEIISVDW